jgi:endonuclease/exonuclease/phosphatase (EEP) superfamily protein YafD
MAFVLHLDWLALLLVVPLPLWCFAGLAIAALGWWVLRAPLSWISSVLWLLVLMLAADEVRVLANYATPEPKKNVPLRSDGKTVMRVMTLNCRNFEMGNPVPAILEWHPDIVLLQEIHPFWVRSITEQLFHNDGGGDYRVHKANGIVSRWPIRDMKRDERYRDLHVLIEQPDGALLTVANVHLLSAVTDLRPWSLPCWREHWKARQMRRDEMLKTTQSLASLTPTRVQASIIGGDFNAPPQDSCFDLLNGNFDDGYMRSGVGWPNTFPARSSFLRLDRILSTNGLRSVRAKVLNLPQTDHRMVIVDYVRQ